MNECWFWHGATTGGYGRYRGRYAHRVSYAFFYGGIPPGMDVLHKCDQPSCVNPLHLFVGTDTDNMQDMIRKGRGNWARGEDSGKSKLTEEAVLEIAYSLETGRKMAAKFGISEVCVSNIRNGVTWAHLTKVKREECAVKLRGQSYDSDKNIREIM